VAQFKKSGSSRVIIEFSSANPVSRTMGGRPLSRRLAAVVAAAFALLIADRRGRRARFRGRRECWIRFLMACVGLTAMLSQIHSTCPATSRTFVHWRIHVSYGHIVHLLT